MTGREIGELIEKLIESPFTSYYISQKTGITEQTIFNYRRKKTVPTQANAKLLGYFFRDELLNKIQKKIEKNEEIQNFLQSKISGEKKQETEVQISSDGISWSDIHSLILEKDIQISRLLSIIEKMNEVKK